MSETMINKNRSLVISLVGRPNVGKSSIFNRLMKKAHKSITYDQPGVTRDRHYGIATFDMLGQLPAKDAILVDTGGFYPEKIEENVPRKKDQIMNQFFNIMTEQAKLAILESDLILFVADIREGLLPFDESIVKYLRKEKKDFWLVLNKFDTEKQLGDELEFYSLGIEENAVFKISAEHGLGFGDLSEAIQKKINAFEERGIETENFLSKGITPREKVVSRVAIVGAPNAGKSTLLNHLLGSERALVSNIPGTTVDPIEGFFDLYFGADAKILDEDLEFLHGDSLLVKSYEEFRKNNPELYTSLTTSYNLEEEGTKGTPIYEEDEAELFIDEDEDAAGSSELEQYEELFSEAESDAEVIIEEDISGTHWRSIHLVDTAGIRRQKAVSDFIEQQSVYRSLRAITESEIVIFMIDAVEGIGHQDRRLIDIALDKGKSVIVALNKFDLLKTKIPDEKAKKIWLEDLRRNIPWLKFCDLIPVSAKYGTNISRLREALKKTIMVRHQKIGTSALNRFILHLLDNHPIPLKGTQGKRFKVKYASMMRTSPPTFLLFTNLSKGIPDNFKTYLKNGLRQEFKLANTPIHLIFRSGGDLQKRLQKRLKEI